MWLPPAIECVAAFALSCEYMHQPPLSKHPNHLVLARHRRTPRYPPPLDTLRRAPIHTDPFILRPPSTPPLLRQHGMQPRRHRCPIRRVFAYRRLVGLVVRCPLAYERSQSHSWQRGAGRGGDVVDRARGDVFVAVLLRCVWQRAEGDR